ncbi:MAG: flavin reductase family protein [Gammaproteobacteria bacterium]|nr:flavin reductase family protein [Gammaproteobacteria bacterium]
MNADTTASKLVELDLGDPIWGRFYTVHPLVLVGTREEDGGIDLAPKHLAMPMSWQNHFGFVCTPAHGTYQNIKRSGQFTVTFVRPSQTVLASLSATPRCENGDKPIVSALPTFPATKIDADFLQDGYLFLECQHMQTVDGLADNSLIIGEIVSARIAADALRSSDQDDQDLFREAPLLAYLYPDRFAEIKATNKLPFPAGFKR